MAKRPVLVTITSPTASGKSYLFNYIRDVVKLPCLISTTTRPPRKIEVDGKDYYFISHDESVEIERQGQFAELATYRGIRYGVTKTEFQKLSSGIAFLIVEPSGIEHYVQPAKQIGALHYKIFVRTETDVRISRFKERMYGDLLLTLGELDRFKKVFDTHIDRFEAMFTEELAWDIMCDWDLIISGVDPAQKNVDIILRSIEQFRTRNSHSESVVYVCPIKDIECGSHATNWCTHCPKRAL